MAVDLLVGFEHASPGSEAFVVGLCCHSRLMVSLVVEMNQENQVMQMLPEDSGGELDGEDWE